MNQTLLIRYPLSIRRIDYKSQDPSANMETCPLATFILLKYIKCLYENPLNRKNKQNLRNEPNINASRKKLSEKNQRRRQNTRRRKS